PTPPLPAKKTNWGLDAGDRRREPGEWSLLLRLEAFDIDAGDPVSRRHTDGAGLLPLDFADPREDVALGSRKLFVGDFSELELHLWLEQLLAERRIVLHLGLSRGDDFVEDKAQGADQEGVEDEQFLRLSPTSAGYSRSYTAATVRCI